jgi:hypothetical protein
LLRYFLFLEKLAPAAGCSSIVWTLFLKESASAASFCLLGLVSGKISAPAAGCFLAWAVILANIGASGDLFCLDSAF